MSVSDKIDRVVTNRWLTLPIFAGIMWLVYYVSVTTFGGWLTDWTNDVLFGTWITNAANHGLAAAHCAPWLQSLLVDGIIGGVGTVLGFVPQMILLFLFLALLEDSGYRHVSPLSWTGCSDGSVCRANRSFRCWSAPDAACQPSCPRALLKTRKTAA